MKHEIQKLLALVVILCLRRGCVCVPRSRRQSPAPAGASDELSVDQARLADRFDRFETVLARLAELSASTDPRRAKILREAIARSREEGSISVSRRSSPARKGAALRCDRPPDRVQKELDDLLTLLLKADRDRELDSQHKRIKAYLKEVGRLIRLEKGLQARTEGGDDTKRLAKDQQQVGDQTGELGKSISDTERRTPTGNPADSKSGSGPTRPTTKTAKPSEGKPADRSRRKASRARASRASQ